MSQAIWPPDFWLEQAKAMRERAEAATDRDLVWILLRIADDYEMLAKDTEALRSKLRKTSEPTAVRKDGASGHRISRPARRLVPS